VRYTVNGEELTSSSDSRVASSGEERDMYRWASQHPPGTPLPLRYDPQHHNMIVEALGGTAATCNDLRHYGTCREGRPTPQYIGSFQINIRIGAPPQIARLQGISPIPLRH
jgi:hypothetical protein